MTSSAPIELIGGIPRSPDLLATMHAREGLLGW